MASFDWKWHLSDLEPPKDDAPTVFSCFACGGGSSMGYKKAGFNVLGNCEIDPKIAEIYKRNLHPKYSYVMDIRDFNNLEDIPDELMHLDVLDGSPPCSTFSTAGDRERAWGKEKQFAEGQKLQTLDDLFFVFLNTVAKLMPKIVVAENVTGLVKGNAKGYVNEIISRFKKLGYAVQMFWLDASFMDVPQKRERIFFIANRCKLSKLELEFSQKPIVFGDIRDDIGIEGYGNNCELIKKYGLKSDSSMNDINKRVLGKISGFNNIIFQDHRVASTLAASGDTYRGCDATHPTIIDMVHISSFPEDYNFLGASRTRVQFICGMSVPPNMMAHIATEIRRQWLD